MYTQLMRQRANTTNAWKKMNMNKTNEKNQTKLNRRILNQSENITQKKVAEVKMKILNDLKEETTHRPFAKHDMRIVPTLLHNYIVVDTLFRCRQWPNGRVTATVGLRAFVHWGNNWKMMVICNCQSNSKLPFSRWMFVVVQTIYTNAYTIHISIGQFTFT